MIQINPPEPNQVKITDPPVKKEQTPPPAAENKDALKKQDSLTINPDLKKQEFENVFNNKSETKTAPVNTDTDQTDPKPKAAHPWRVKNLHVSYGLQDVRFSKSDIHVSQPGYNTDVTLHNVEGEQRTSYTFIYGKPRFAPDEPEFSANVSMEFENRFGLELDVKHNKYTVQKFDQNVLMTGTMAGEDINEVRPFDSYSNLYDITAGNHQISLLATRSFPLPAPKNHQFTFNTKIGPSAIVSYSHNSFKNPDGEFEGVDRGKIAYAGYGAMVENSLKYDLGRKLGGVTVEVSHSLSYLNFTKVPVPNGTANQAMFASQFAVTIGKTFDFHKK